MITIRKLLAPVAAVLVLACAGGSDGNTAPAQRVTVTRKVTSWTSAGTKTTAPDETVQSIAALVQGAGGVTRFEGAEATPGTWVIPDVPEGPYLLELRVTTSAIPAYFASSADAVDLGFERVGRTAPRPTLSTPVTFEMTGLVPWGADWLQLYCADVNLWNQYLPSIASGATNAAETFDWLGDDQSLFSPPMVNPLVTASDELWFVQYRSRVAPTIPWGYQTGVSAAELHVDTHDGVATTATADFVPVTHAGALTADWKFTQFTALLQGDVNPQHLLTISAVPAPVGARSPAVGSMSVDLFEALVWPPDASAPTTDVSLAAVPYGRFLPSVYREYRTASSTAGVTRALPGTGLFTTEYASLRRMDAVEGAPAAIVPLVGPVRNVRIDGRDAMSVQSGVGETPTVSWDPPAVGTAAWYEVFVRELAPNDGGTALRVRSVARLVTGDTRVVLPPGLLAAGGAYLLRIEARSVPNGDAEHAPLRTGLPFGGAMAVTEVFTR